MLNASNDNRWLPKLTVIRRDVFDSEKGRRILTRLGELNISVMISDLPWSALAKMLKIEKESSARNVLVLESTPVKNVRREAFAQVVTRPDHFFGSQGMNCPYKCEYCYLYANSTGIVPLVLYTDLTATMRRVSGLIEQAKTDLTFNFGEDTDSLATEHLTGSATELITFFGRNRATLELRTKSGLVDELLDAPHNGRTTIGISIAPPIIAQKYEHLAAPVEERLSAGGVYARAGYKVALKFEPGILVDDWGYLYTDLVRSLLEWFRDQSPVHVSLGCFRYRPELAQAIARNFPGNHLSAKAREEYVPGRFSYSIEERQRFYELVVDELRSLWPKIPVYLSMESSDMCDRFNARPWLPDYEITNVQLVLDGSVSEADNLRI